METRSLSNISIWLTSELTRPSWSFMYISAWACAFKNTVTRPSQTPQFVQRIRVFLGKENKKDRTDEKHRWQHLVACPCGSQCPPPLDPCLVALRLASATASSNSYITVGTTATWSRWQCNWNNGKANIPAHLFFLFFSMEFVCFLFILFFLYTHASVCLCLDKQALTYLNMSLPSPAWISIISLWLCVTKCIFIFQCHCSAWLSVPLCLTVYISIFLGPSLLSLFPILCLLSSFCPIFLCSLCVISVSVCSPFSISYLSLSSLFSPCPLFLSPLFLCLIFPCLFFVLSLPSILLFALLHDE